MFHHHKTNPRIKLLSFSPDDKFDTSHKNHTKPFHLPTSTQRRLYQIYKQQIHHHKNEQNQSHFNFQQSIISNNRLQPNPEDDPNNNNNKLFLSKIKLNKHNQNENDKKFIVGSNINENGRKIGALSTNVIVGNNKCRDKIIINKSKSRPQSNKSFSLEKDNSNFNKNPMNINTLYNPLSLYTQYINKKHSYKQLISTRIQNEKDLTFLSRTFYSTRKQEQHIKKQLVKMLGKTIQLQQKEKQKQQIRKRNSQWLQKQRNQNHTKKYMNHLMKYEAKKSLLQTNNLVAKQIRQRSQSGSSLKSIRSTLSSRQKMQRSRLMKQQIQENIQKGKQRKANKIRQKSNSVRENKMKIYQCQSNIQSWRISELDSKARMLVQTIENSRRNKQLLKNVVNSIDKNKRKSSQSIINQLNKTLTTIRGENMLF